MKKMLVLFLSAILCLGCSTLNRPKVVVDLNKGIESSLVESKIWWLIILHDDKGAPLLYWVIKDDSLIFMQGSKSIIFKDPSDGLDLRLDSNYSFTIIKMGEWYHPSFDVSEKYQKYQKYQEDQEDRPNRPKKELFV